MQSITELRSQFSENASEGIFWKSSFKISQISSAFISLKSNVNFV